MRRSLIAAIKQDLGKKIVLLCGPRQVGKTTLSKALVEGYDYLNFDHRDDRARLLKQDFDFGSKLLILDELHKMRQWKRWLKGLHDTKKMPPTLVTGSAKLNTYKKAGDSLAGRFFSFQLFPLDLKELAQVQPGNVDEQLEQLLTVSGFPEPFLAGSERHYKRWRQTHMDVILRQDILATENVRHITELENLAELMRERVGSSFSHNSLREDLHTDDKSIKRWMGILESAYVLFKITPYSHRLANMITKAPKYYFYDVPRVSDPGGRFENLVALSLLKEVSYRREYGGEDYSLHYARSKSQGEIDFVVCLDRKPVLAIETKLSDSVVSKSFATLGKRLGKILYVQLVKDLARSYTNKDGVHVAKAADWLSKMEF